MSTSSTGPLPRSAEMAIGTRLGRYELLAPIAAGGMAEVFVARALGEGGFQRLVAVKRILPELASDERFVDMFLDEGRLAGLVTSPNVVQVLDVAKDDDGTLYMVLELVRGVALHRLLRAAKSRGVPLTTPILVGILAQAADGLAAAHGALSPEGEPMNIVHRDVSPQNILVGIDGRARIADFGVARALHRRTTTDPGELRGKLGYFAPEQIQGRPATARSDVFALSVVAWEAFAGARLFRGETPYETLRAIRTSEPAALHTLRDDVPAALAAAIARGLAKRPEMRTASAHELATAMREAVPEASAIAIASVVRELVGPVVEELDARIRHALDGAETTMRRAPSSRGADDLDTDAHATALFEIDGDTRTQLHAPDDTRAPTRRSRSVPWMIGVGLAATGAAIVVALASSSSGVTATSPTTPARQPIEATTTPTAVEPPAVEPASNATTSIDSAAIDPPTERAVPAPTTVEATEIEPVDSARIASTQRSETRALAGTADVASDDDAPAARGAPRVRRAPRTEPRQEPAATTARTGGLRSTEDFARTLRSGRTQ